MNLRRREKLLALAAAAVVLLWLLDSFVLTPVWERYRQDRAEALAVQQELFKAEQLLRRADALEAQHGRRAAAGLGLPVSQAEGKMVEAVEKWASRCGLREVSMRPERLDPEQGVQAIRCRVTAAGPMSALVGACWRMETASIPLRIEHLRVSAPDSTVDRLSIQFDISTVCLAADETESGRHAAAAGARP
jgi:hypothetical protein